MNVSMFGGFFVGLMAYYGFTGVVLGKLGIDGEDGVSDTLLLLCAAVMCLTFMIAFSALSFFL